MRDIKPNKITIIVLTLLLIFSLCFNIYYYVSSALRILTCGGQKYTSERFKELCEATSPGTKLIDALVVLGSPSINRCEGDTCIVTIFGGDNLLCDQCQLTYQESNMTVTSSEWTYGDD